MKNESFSIRARMQSIRYAWEGIYRFFVIEHNARIHLLSTIAMLIAAYILHISANELLLLLIVTALVWISEIFNTSIEKAMDLLVPEQRPEVKFIKDLAAAAVLIATCLAVIVGACIFLPKII